MKSTLLISLLTFSLSSFAGTSFKCNKKHEIELKEGRQSGEINIVVKKRKKIILNEVIMIHDSNFDDFSEIGSSGTFFYAIGIGKKLDVEVNSGLIPGGYWSRGYKLRSSFRITKSKGVELNVFDCKKR